MKPRALVAVGLCAALWWGLSGDIARTQATIDQSILPAAFQTPWDPGIPGGIPRDDDPVRPATVWLPTGNPYGGYSVDPSLTGVGNAAAFSVAFQAAINAAGAGATPTSRRIVRLKTGTYFVNPQIDSGGEVGIVVKVDNVTIRGEGAERTRIVANGPIADYGTVILFGHRRGNTEADFALQRVTASALRGSRTIQIANASDYTVGDIITIDRLDGEAVPSGDARINGGYLFFFDASLFKRQPGFSWLGPGTGAPAFPALDLSDFDEANAAATTIVPKWRSTSQQTEIVGVSGNALTTREPLYIDFPVSTTTLPEVWRTVPINTSAIPVGNRWSGIEDLAVAGGSNPRGFPGGGISFSYMAYSWAKGVEVDGEPIAGDPAHPGKRGFSIGLARSYRCVVRDSYVHHATDQNSGGQAYGIVVAAGTSDSLIENNIARHHSKPIVLNVTGGGNVIAYNYVDDAAVERSPGWQQNGIDDAHSAFTHHDLIEGNWTPNLGSGTTHGNSGWHTHFRNYASGENSSGGMTQNLRAVGMDGWTHDHAYVGNVLGGGTVYEMKPPNPGTGRPIYQLGRNLPIVCGHSCWDNGYAAAHIYRDGNWDNVSNSVVWAGGARAMPPSMYLTTKPAFFGPYAWPWVEPTAATATGRVMTLPAKDRYDRGRPFGMTAVTLTTSHASPQPTGTTITLTATGSGGSAPYTYRFWVQPWGGTWQLVGDWAPAATYAWTPTAVSGYNLSVEARSAGASDAEAQAATGFEITSGGGGNPMTGVTLMTFPSSPQPLGTAISVAASGTGGTAPYAYRFWIQPWGGAWQLARDWSATATYAWTPTATGGYNLSVEAHSAGAASAEVQASTGFTISTAGGGGGPMTGVTLSPSLPSPQVLGTAIMLMASGAGGTTPYSYRFWVQPGGGTSQLVRDWGQTATYSWNPTAAGSYTLTVDARSSGATAAEVQSSIGYTITSGGGGPMTGVALTTSLPSPQPSGTPITLSAVGSGGTTPYAYRFWIQPWGGAWQLVRDWAAAATYAWTPTATGGYNLSVEAHSAGAASAEVQAATGFTIATGGGGGGPMTGVTLTTSLPSPQVLGMVIMLTASGAGGTTPYSYRFWVQPWGGVWQLVRDWSPTATYAWTPTATGGYNLSVEAHSAGAASAEVQAATGFTIVNSGAGGSAPTGDRARGL